MITGFVKPPGPVLGAADAYSGGSNYLPAGQAGLGYQPERRLAEIMAVEGLVNPQGLAQLGRPVGQVRTAAAAAPLG